MREITEEEKEEMVQGYSFPPTRSILFAQKHCMRFIFEELTRRGFKIVKEENPK